MRISVFLSALLLVSVSCAKQDPLIGKWQKVGGGRWVEYFADGSLLAKQSSEGMGGNWKRLEDGRVKVEIKGGGFDSVDVYQVKIEGDKATLTDSEGYVEKFERKTGGPGPAAEKAAEAPVKDGFLSEEEQWRQERLRDEEMKEGMQGIRTDADAQKQTIRDIRGVGTAMFSWLTDHVGAAAAGEAEQMSIGSYPAISREELESLLTPNYIKRIPERDGWGNLYEFYLNVSDPLAKQVMCIRSVGRDGVAGSGLYRVGAFAPNDFDRDIVWADGFFVQWPDGRSMP